MEKLVRGVQLFRKTVYEPNRDLYRSLIGGQKPHTLFIACSDSRLSTESLTQTGPGELFVMRNAGNLVPPHGASRGGEAATIEYAVAGLKVRNIVVCGHFGCGAIQAMLEPHALDDLPETARWLRHAEATRRIAREKTGQLSPAALWDATVEVNVLVQVENLRTHPAVAAALVHGKVNIYGWVFDLRTGEVRSFDPACGTFAPLPGGPDEAGDLSTAVTPPLTAYHMGHGPLGPRASAGSLTAAGDGLGSAHS
jgi:carbonic anhydrase